MVFIYICTYKFCINLDFFNKKIDIMKYLYIFALNIVFILILTVSKIKKLSLWRQKNLFYHFYCW